MKKRWISVFLAVVLALGLFSVSASAATTVDDSQSYYFSMTTSDETVCPYGEFTLTVSLQRTDTSSDFTMYAVSCQIRVPNSLFEVVDATVSYTSSSFDCAATVSSASYYDYVAYNALCYTGTTWSNTTELMKITVRTKAAGLGTISFYRYSMSTSTGFASYSATCTDDFRVSSSHTIVVEEGYDATCTTAGLSDGRYCSVCGTRFSSQETIPALGHSWDSGTVVKKATKRKDGQMLYTCTRCGATYYATIAADGTVEEPEDDLDVETGQTTTDTTGSSTGSSSAAVAEPNEKQSEVLNGSQYIMDSSTSAAITVNDQGQLVSIDVEGNETILDDTKTYTITTDENGETVILNEDGEAIEVDDRDIILEENTEADDAQMEALDGRLYIMDTRTGAAITVNDQDQLVSFDRDGNETVLDDTQTYTITADENGETVILNEDGQQITVKNGGIVIVEDTAEEEISEEDTAETGGEDASEDSSAVAETNSDTESSSSSGHPMVLWIILILVIVLVIAAVVVFLVLRKKKQKKDS